MKFHKYLKEGKMGKLPGRVVRTAWEEKEDSPPFEPYMLEWKLENPDVADQKVNYEYIQDLAYRELIGLKRKKIVDFYEDQFNVYTGNDYTAVVKLKSYDYKKITSALKRLKFKIIKR